MVWFSCCLFVEIVAFVGVFRFVILFVFYDYVYALRVLPAETRLAVYRRLRVDVPDLNFLENRCANEGRYYFSSTLSGIRIQLINFS